MRHRITSFRCVEAVTNMNRQTANYKSCNAILFRQSSATSRRRLAAAILENPRSFGPARHDKRTDACVCDRPFAPREGDVVEQWIVGGDSGGQIACGEARCE